MTCPTHDTIPSWLLVFSVHKRKDRCRCQMTIRAPDLVRSALASISPSRFVSNQRHSIPLASVHFFSNQRQDSVPLSIPDRLAVLSSKHSWSSRHAHDPEVTGSLQYLFWRPKIRNSRVQSSSTMSNELPVPDGPLPQGTPLPPPFYWPFDPPFVDQRNAAREKLRRYNNTGFSTLSTTDLELQRKQILTELFGKINPAKPPFIEPPFQCDYGFNIEVGDDCYMNFGCCILDCAKVTIGNKVMFGPNVQIYCPGHPLDPVLRNGLNGFEFGLPVKVGNDVWIGGGAILLPGVTVGDGSVVGAGAVVTKDVEPMVVVAGNPAKVVKRIQKGDWGKPKTHGNIKKGTVDT